MMPVEKVSFLLSFTVQQQLLKMDSKVKIKMKEILLLGTMMNIKMLQLTTTTNLLKDILDLSQTQEFP
jgi:hypothetical protein